MVSRLESFVGLVVALTAIAALGVLRLYSDRRLRVRGQLSTSPRLRRVQRGFAAALVATAAGLLSLIGAAFFEVPWLGRAGAVVAVAGFLVAVGAFAALLRERFQDRPRHGARQGS